MLLLVMAIAANARSKYDNTDTLVVARDGSGEFRTVGEAVEVCRAFMEYRKVIFVKKGTYKEKVIVPSWLTNIEIIGESRDNTIITYDDHANIKSAETGKPMGTFRTFTVKVEGSDITFRNITIENNAEKLGQAVALHTEGDRLKFINCRFLGNQDTVYTGVAGTRLLFKDCYIEGTTDFIFYLATAWFENCDIHSKADSFITAASTPQNVKYGYIFNNCRLTADAGITKVYLGRLARIRTHFVHELHAGQAHHGRGMAQLERLSRPCCRGYRAIHGIQQPRRRSRYKSTRGLEQDSVEERGYEDNIARGAWRME